MWENLAIQIPIVIAFIWFVLETDKRNAVYAKQRDDQWREFLAAQYQITATALEKAAGAIERVADKLDNHDSAMREALARMEAATEITLIKKPAARKQRNP